MAFSLNDFDDILEYRKGGIARVYTATQRSLNRKVIIKEMTCTPAEAPVQKRRFENEAKSAAALDHDNIIRVFDFGEKGNSYYICMEYVDGFDLEELLQNPDVPLPIILAIVLQALKGIRYSHSRGIVHRDIKPANILAIGADIDLGAAAGKGRLEIPVANPLHRLGREFTGKAHDAPHCLEDLQPLPKISIEDHCFAADSAHMASHWLYSFT